MSLEQIVAIVAALGGVWGLVIAGTALRRGCYIKYNILQAESYRIERTAEPGKFWLIVGGVLVLSCGLFAAAIGLALKV